MTNKPFIHSNNEKDSKNNSEKFPHRYVSIIIPAYNEEDGITSQIRAVNDVMDKTEWNYELIVVDDGSTDKTAEHVQGSGVTVAWHDRNKGKGAALKTGFSIARTRKRVSCETPGLLFNTSETVVIDTPLCRAMSLIVGLFFITPRYFSIF